MCSKGDAELAFSAYRERRMRSFVSLVSLVAGALSTPAIVKSAWSASWGEVHTLVLMLVTLLMPAAAAKLGTPELFTTVYIVSHLLGSLVEMCVGFGALAAADAMITLLDKRQELFPEALLSLQGQTNLLVMACLHGMRMLAQYFILVRQMGADPASSAFRMLLNWAFLMTLQVLFEIRSWALYAKQQQAHELACAAALHKCAARDPTCSAQCSACQCYQQSSSSCACAASSAPTSSSTSCCSEVVAPAVAPTPQAALLYGRFSCDNPPSSHYQPGLSDIMETLDGSQRASLDSRRTSGTSSTSHSSNSAAADALRTALSLPSDGVLATAPATHKVSHNGMGSPILGVVTGVSTTALDTAALATAMHMDTFPDDLPDHLSQPESPRDTAWTAGVKRGLLTPMTVQACLAIVKQQQLQPYIRTSRSARRQVDVKLRDLEPEMLPADLPQVFQQQLRPCLPGAVVSSWSLRHGCAIISMDLMGAPGGGVCGAEDDTLGADVLVRLVSRVMNKTGLDKVLSKGSSMQLQVSDVLSCYGWDVDHRQFQLAATTSAGQVPEDCVSQLLQQAAQCHILGTVPAVHCVAADRHQPLVLPLQLQLPSHSRLLGWQPADSSAAPEDGVLVAGTQASSAVPLDVRVLVRQQGGAYLPVSVKLSAHEVTPGAMHNTCMVEVEVSVTLGCSEPVGLELELWSQVQQSATAKVSRPEVRVAMVPLLLLPSAWHGTATELQHHVTSIGGLHARHCLAPDSAGTACPGRDLVDDLGAWLSHMAGVGGGVASEPMLQSAMESLGTDLLFYVITHALIEVARLMRSVLEGDMKSAAGPYQGGWSAGPKRVTSEWLRRAAAGAVVGDARAGVVKNSLLHAAMVSGQPAAVEKVLRWGLLYGGRQWRWPWSLTDEVGCTALHLAAAHADPGMCCPLLAILTRMLPQSEVQAARHVWHTAVGPENSTPAEVFAITHPGLLGDVIWEQGYHELASWLLQTESTESNLGSSKHSGSKSSFDIDPTSPLGPVPLSRASSDGTGATMPVRRTASAWERGVVEASVQGWGRWCGALKQCWSWKPSEEYQCWANEQLTSLVHSWAGTMVAVGVMCMSVSLRAGHFWHELPCILLHTLAYVGMLGTSTGGRRHSDWQVWMPWAPVLHALGYFCLSQLPSALLQTWNTPALSWVDSIYAGLLSSVMEQNALPYVVLSRMVLVYFHSMPFAAAGAPFPLLRALAVQTLAVLVNCVVRVHQLRVFSQWQRQQQQVPGSAASASTASSPSTGPTLAQHVATSAPAVISALRDR